MSRNLLFANLDESQQRRVISRMKLIEIKNGNEVITQGEKHAGTFYVVNSGTFDVSIDDVKVLDYEKGGCFWRISFIVRFTTCCNGCGNERCDSVRSGSKSV